MSSNAKSHDPIATPSWHWGTAEGSREFDRLGDRQMTLLERFRWLESSANLASEFRRIRDTNARRVREDAPADDKLRKTEF